MNVFYAMLLVLILMNQTNGLNRMIFRDVKNGRNDRNVHLCDSHSKESSNITETMFGMFKVGVNKSVIYALREGILWDFTAQKFGKELELDSYSQPMLLKELFEGK
jgi:hypothetical protein